MNNKFKDRSRILYIDDDDTQLMLAKTVLSDCAVARTTRSLEEYFILLREWDFDLIITDIVMPDMNGIALAKRTKNFCPHVPIIAVTGYRNIIKTMVEDEDRAIFLDIIEKPNPWAALKERWL